MVERILASSPGRDVLDVGCGTGIVARQLQAVGCAVLGVEPDARMADFARASGVPVEVATFEAWEPSGRLYDAVVAGTAWHWVDPVAGPAKAASVLREHGLLSPFGTVHELPATVADALAEAFRRAMPDSPFALPSRSNGSILDAYEGLYVRAADGIRQAGGFDEPEIWRYDRVRSLGRDAVLDLVSTSGGMTNLAPAAIAEVLTAVGAAIDELGGTVSVAYATWGVTARRTGGSGA